MFDMYPSPIEITPQMRAEMREELKKMAPFILLGAAISMYLMLAPEMAPFRTFLFEAVAVVSIGIMIPTFAYCALKWVQWFFLGLVWVYRRAFRRNI